MTPRGGPAGLDLGVNWTPLVRNLLVALFAIYVVQLLLGGTLERWLAWNPLGDGFAPWQVFTAFLLGGPSPLGAFFGWLAIFFLVPPLERMLGRRALARAMGVSWLAGVVAAMVAAALGAHQAGVILGASPLIGAMIGLWGFTVPNAVIHLFFVLPVKASWLGWGTGLLAFLYMLATREVVNVLAFFAWAGAWAWAVTPGDWQRRWKLKKQERELQKKLSRFQVLEGGKEAPPRRRFDDLVN